MFTSFDESISTYGYTVTANWDYTQEHSYKDDVIKDKRRIYIHYYYSIEKGADDEQAFDKRIAGLYKEDAIKEARRYFCYFALIANETLDALHSPPSVPDEEFTFCNIKERLNMRRLLVSSEKGLDGKIFTEFVALILILSS